VLRLHTQTGSKVVPCLHYPIDTFTAHPLHRMGQKLSPTVSRQVDARNFHYHSSDSDRQLFGENEDGGSELDEAEKQGENG
jgi:hypothetical protein